MTDFECFQLFVALKLHFNDPRYNYFSYDGAVRKNDQSFEWRNDRYNFYALNNRHPKRGDMIYFIVSNLVVNSNFWVTEALEERAEEVYRDFKRRIQSLSYLFEGDCRKLFGDGDIFHTTGDYPTLLTKYLQGEIMLETVCILNTILNFIPTWDIEIKDDIVWPSYKLRFLRYAMFLKLDYERYERLLKKHYK